MEFETSTNLGYKMAEDNVWIWKEPDCRWKRNILNFIKNTDSIEKEIVLLHCSEVERFDSSIPLANFILNLAEELGIFQKERTMFLSPKDLSQAIELCLERLAGKTDKETQIRDEDIINCHKDYVEHFEISNKVTDNKVLQIKIFIDENNCADLWLILDLLKKSEQNITEHLSQKKILLLGTPQSDIFQKVIHLLTPDGSISNIVVETPLNASLLGSPSSSIVEVTTEKINVKDVAMDNGNAVLGSATEEYVEDIITSFFSLLVNSRNELVLAKVMISPIIDLSHDAFTELKHLAEKKEMPMCQTALSYVTRLQLGGKGYAPPPDCPLLSHLKKLEVFVNTLNQMQNIIEEDPTPVSAVKRLINIFKKKLLKSGSDKLRESAIESASENLKDIAVKISNIMKSEKCKVSAPQVCQENLDFLHHFVNYVNCRCLTFDPKSILLQKQTKRTPISLPPLLGYFRSPEEESSCDAKSVLDEDSLISNSSTSLNQHVPYFHFSESSSVPGTCIDSSTPSKTSFKGCLPIEKDDENPDDSPKFKVPKKSAAKKGRKRTILGEITNENLPRETKKAEDNLNRVIKETTKNNSEKKMKLAVNNSNVKTDKNAAKAAPKKEPKVNKSKISKKFKLIEGQGKITSFFKK